MKKLLIVGFAAAAFSNAPAIAADMPVKAVAPIPASWDGCYWGGNIGYSWGRSRNDVTAVFNPGPTLEDSLTVRDDPSGVIGGGQLGCNRQTGNFVWGLETDFQFSGQRDHANFDLDSGDGTSTFNWTDKNVWLGTTRLRGGVIVNNLLFYGTGGVAYGKYKIDMTSTGGIAAGSASISSTKAGYAIGAGIESPFVNNWNWRLEYLYTRIKWSGSAVLDLDTITVHSRESDNIIRFAINYRFGDWGKAPVIAKY
jgi:outer membrane immunogenic protein